MDLFYYAMPLCKTLKKTPFKFISTFVNTAILLIIATNALFINYLSFVRKISI